MRYKYLFLGLLFYGCEGVQKDRRISSVDATVKCNSIGRVKRIPNEMDGGACYFFRSRQDSIEGSYTLVNDFGTVAFVSLNDTLVKFDFEKSDSLNNTYYYRSDGARLEVRVEEYDGKLKGQMELEINGVTELVDIIGACEC